MASMADSAIKICNPLSHKVSHVCLLQNCNENLLCNQCYETHNGFHLAHIKPLNEILDFNPKAKLEEIKDLGGVSSQCHEKIHYQFHILAEKVKKDISALIDKIMIPPPLCKSRSSLKPVRRCQIKFYECSESKKSESSRNPR